MRKLIRDRNLHDIAAAIRTKNGSNGTYKPREMADAIRALPSPSTLISKTITQNGSYSPQSENADGFSSVTVNVGRNLVRKDITRNGSFSAASDHVDGYSSVSVNVPNSYSALDEGKVVSSGTLTPQTSLSVTQNGTFDTTRNNQVTVNVSGASNTLVSKTMTANGTYLPADDNADGFNWVNVAVPGGFEASDEGKVIVNGALMPQSSLTVTANGTYDTTDKNSVVVDVRNVFNPLPSGYTELSHIATNGASYFDADLVSTDQFGFFALYKTSSDAYQNVFGGFNAAPSDAYFLTVSRSTSLYVYLSGNNFSLATSGSSGHLYSNLIAAGALCDGSTIHIFGSEVSSSSITSHTSPGCRIAVCSFFDFDNVGGTHYFRTTDCFYGKLYRLRFFNGNLCVSDMVPCLDPQGVAGVYDLVRGRFFSSDTSVPFTAGVPLHL